MKKLFFVDPGNRGYGSFFFAVVEADNLKEAQDKAKGKFARLGKDEMCQWENNEISFDEQGVSQLFEIGW